MTKYLVTGGAGFIGSHIVDALIHAGHSVRVLDDLSTGQRVNLAHHGDAVELVVGDLRDMATVARCFEGVRGVFHEAALPSVPRSVEDPLTCNAVNVDGSLNVFVAARNAGAKVVYAGSSSAYGDTEVLPKHEGMPVSPMSPYAAAKVATEQYLASFAKVYGMETVTLRYFNVFGPRQRNDSPYSGVIAKFCRNALKGEACRIEGDGLQSRDFTYVHDVARGNLLAMETALPGGTTMNLAGGDRISLLDMLDELENLVGHKVERTHVGSRAGDVKHSQADARRAKALLGFTCEHTFAAGLRETLDWYRESIGAAAVTPEKR
ncbi:MAG: NAD-dependent epimerase/dehydratase family protein [Planctomycetes bacterium]|nr:NAD-dependent epimerase/dehydratase family protein [Planctomycetota bacterium]MCB9918103.1 NAD-dependent epimerase/dehydratase family protein [Planctomycetota bacterium]